MTKNRKGKTKEPGTRSGKADVSQVEAEANVAIERGIRRIHGCQEQLDRKALHIPYGKQQMVETICGAGRLTFERTFSANASGVG